MVTTGPDALLTNASVVTPGGVVDGSVVVADGRIAEIVVRRYQSGVDLEGAVLMPSVSDVHTDYLERELRCAVGKVARTAELAR